MIRHVTHLPLSLTGEMEDIKSSLESLRDKGFINYYGLQRFGTTSVPTHHVGRAILQSRWMDAINLILKPREGETDEMTEARNTWAVTKDAEATLGKIHQRGIEQDLLTGLVHCRKTDYVGALNMLSRNTRLMYVHAYQSYIWNVVASRRLKEFGLKVMEGDLVLQPTSAKLSSSEKVPVTLTAEMQGNYTVHDVVMPLPGWDVQFPTNVIGDWYHALLKEDGLSKANLKNKIRDYSLPGDYRHLVVKPGTLEWSILNYEDVTQSLVLSDFEKLNGEKLAEPVGSNRALRLELSLPSSTYATMALREVLRADTSACHQASLNK